MANVQTKQQNLTSLDARFTLPKSTTMNPFKGSGGRVVSSIGSKINKSQSPNRENENQVILNNGVSETSEIQKENEIGSLNRAEEKANHMELQDIANQSLI